MFFGNPKPKGEHFYSQPADKRMRQHQRWMKRCGWAGWTIILVLLVGIAAIAGYGILIHYDNANPFREPIVVPIKEENLSRFT